MPLILTSPHTLDIYMCVLRKKGVTGQETSRRKAWIDDIL